MTKKGYNKAGLNSKTRFVSLKENEVENVQQVQLEFEILYINSEQ